MFFIFFIHDFSKKSNHLTKKSEFFNKKKYHFEEIHGLGEKTVQIKDICRLNTVLLAE
jgi:hypothetical protein